MKTAAPRAVLGNLEYKNGTGEWFKDELTYRFRRVVARCDLRNDKSSGFMDLGQPAGNNDSN